MRVLAALILALCGVLLLLTWHYGGNSFWIWERASYHIDGVFRLALIGDLDFCLKIAGLAFLAAAIRTWPKS